MLSNRVRTRRGMTLVELMVVVVIVGILSVLAVNGYRKYTYNARNSEAAQFLGAVRAAQEAYFQSFGQYCGTAAGEAWPNDIPVINKKPWGTPDNAWADLGIKSPGNVWFQYTLMANRTGAGAPGDSFKDPPTNTWFVARAHGDFDGDGVLSTFEVTSAKPEVYSNNENK